jgi:hypothetical protein
VVIRKGGPGASYHVLDALEAHAEGSVGPIVGDKVRCVEFLDLLQVTGVPDLVE